MPWVCPNCGTNNDDSNVKCSVCDYELPQPVADVVDKPYIFVSYSHQDVCKVYPFILALQEHFYVWFDKKGIKHGSEYAAEIEEKIDNCAGFLYMITSNSMASRYCRGEINHAFDLDKPFVNILLNKREEIEFSKGFHTQYGIYQYFELNGYKGNYEDSLSGLVNGASADVLEGFKKSLRLGKSLPSATRPIATRPFTEETACADAIVPKGELTKEIAQKLSPDKDGTLIIPHGYESIGGWAFSCRLNIKKIVIPNSVTIIGMSAFLYCPDLNLITIPDSVISINAATFEECKGLTSIAIPDSVTGIGFQAFYLCRGLTSITIGSGVTSINSLAFAGCTSLTSITYKGTKSQWNAISKKSNWNLSTGNYTIHCTDGDIAKA